MKKSLIALLLALVVLGAFLFANRSREKAAGVQSFAFDSTKMNEVGFFYVQKKPDTSALELSNGAWRVSKDSFPVDTGKINKVLHYMYQLQNSEIVSKNPDRATEYGLDTGNAKHVAWKDKSGKEIARIVIGKTSGADYSSTYWKFEEKPEVYRTPGNFTWDVATRGDDWKDRKLFPFVAKDIQTLEVTWKDSLGVSFNFKLEAVNDTSYKLLAPQTSPALRAMAGEMFNRLGEMSIDDFPIKADTNLPKIKLDSPTVDVKIQTRAGKNTELVLGKSFEGYTYGRHPARADLIKISNWRLDVFKKKPFEIVELPKDTSHADTSKSKVMMAPAASSAAMKTMPAKPATTKKAEPKPHLVK